MLRKRLTTTFAVLASLLLCASTALAQGKPTLKVGDKAPPLSNGEWVKGEPVKSFEEGKVYVIECWATWCGPCIAAIPHVTELQHKYADKGLIVIGQNVWESDPDKVKPFVKEMGEKMDYRVVMDSPSGNEGQMAKTWLQAAGQNGIPCSFIIDQKGVIAWIGHPMEMDGPLAKVMAGDFDAKAEAEKDAKVEELGRKLNQAAMAGNIDEAIAAADEIVEIRPEFAGRAAMVKFRLLGQADRWDEAFKHADKAIDSIDDPMSLNELAWTIVAPDSELPKKDLNVAMKAAEKANKLTDNKDAAILDTLARAHWLKGNKEKAVEIQTRAVEHAEDAMKGELEATLAEYRRELQM